MINRLIEVRCLLKLDIEYVSSYLGIEPNELKYYETHPSEMPLGIAVKLTELYNIEIDDVAFI